MRYILLLASLLVLSQPAQAQDYEGLKLPPPGTTILNLSATETQKVPQDLLVASLRVEAEGEDLTAVQSKVNMSMQNALSLAKEQPDIKVVTGGYSVYPYDPTPPEERKNGQERPKRWRAQQTIELKSLKPDVLLKVVGELQGKDFAMSNLGYTLSPEKYESVQDDLMTKAIKKLDAKAALAAKTIGRKNYEMLNVDLSPSGPVYPMYARAEMAMMDSGAPKAMPAPVVSAGETDVSLTVSARVLLKP